MSADRSGEDVERGVVRSEEQLHVGSVLQDVGRVIARKLVRSRRDTEEVERSVEEVELDRTPAEPGDTGEVITLPDGSLSIPLFEEQIVVEKRLVVRERVVLRKFAVAHTEQVEADVRVEHVEVFADEQVSDRLVADADAQDLLRRRDAEAGQSTPTPTSTPDTTPASTGTATEAPGTAAPKPVRRPARPGGRRDPKARSQP